MTDTPQPYNPWVSLPYIQARRPKDAVIWQSEKLPEWVQVAVLPLPPTDAHVVRDAYNPEAGSYICETADGMYITRNPFANKPEWVKVK